MTVGERRKRDPNWHFTYYLGRYDDEELQRIGSALWRKEHTTDDPKWITLTYMQIWGEILRRRCYA